MVKLYQHRNTHKGLMERVNDAHANILEMHPIRRTKTSLKNFLRFVTTGKREIIVAQDKSFEDLQTVGVPGDTNATGSCVSGKLNENKRESFDIG